MHTRTILIFPAFDNMSVIDGLRQQYDPLAHLIRPHITLVFPFESNLSDLELSRILDDRLHGIRPFELTLQGVGQTVDAYGRFLFLQIVTGGQTIIDIHDRLYTHELSPYRQAAPYWPHLTIGKLPDDDLLRSAFADASRLCHTMRFCDTVHTVSVEMIGERGESIVILQKELT